MYRLIGLLVGIIVVILLAKKIKNSKWCNKFADDLTTEKDFSKPETTEVIDKIGKAEKGLGERAKEQKEEAEKLTKESDSIHEFLDKREAADPVVINDREDENKGVKKEGDMPME